jgi:hypothetical protein
VRDVVDLAARTERLLASDRLTAPTRTALRARLDRRYDAPRLFDPLQMRTLQALSARLIPDPDLGAAVNPAGALDAALADGEGDGWRYAEAPPDRRMYGLGLGALNAAALAAFASPFCELHPDRQDALVEAAASGRLESPDVNIARWFEELLCALVELYYAHPLVQVAIGYDGMEDARGVQAVNLADVAKDAALAP